MNYSKPMINRFWAKVNKTETCWLWTGFKNAQGYGIFKAEGKNIRAHCFSWELENGQIPEGMLVCHHCDVKPCVRPDHLFSGTHLDNALDAAMKGRLIMPDNSGERHGMAKLTQSQVAEIRKLYRPYQVTCKDLAVVYGVGWKTIAAIVQNRRWSEGI